MCFAAAPLGWNDKKLRFQYLLTRTRVKDRPRPDSPFCPRHDGVGDRACLIQEGAMKWHKIEDFNTRQISHQSQPVSSNCSPFRIKHGGGGRTTPRGPRCKHQGRAHRKLGRALQSAHCCFVCFASSFVVFIARSLLCCGLVTDFSEQFRHVFAKLSPSPNSS